jgi:cytochrome c-type biogenesis protein CcmH
VSSSVRRIGGWVIAMAASAVIVLGLLPSAAEADPQIRQQQLSQRIACPWCHGQSLAESGSAVAADLVVILREKIDAGWSDQQIYDFFAARYGEQIILDPPWTGWGIALWLLPVLVTAAGGWVIAKRRRAT